MINREDGPWFVAADVCRVLEISNAPQAVGRIDAEDRSTITIADSGNLNASRSIINESGLYAIILTSRKPEARAFKRWVTSEVLPSIRKHGAYIAGQEKVATGEMSREELLARAVKAADSILAEMEQRALAAEQKVVELEPVAAVAQQHVNRGRFTPIGRFARMLSRVNSTRIKVNFAGAGYLYRNGSGYRVYSQSEPPCLRGRDGFFLRDPGATVLIISQGILLARDCVRNADVVALAGVETSYRFSRIAAPQHSADVLGDEPGGHQRREGQFSMGISEDGTTAME